MKNYFKLTFFINLFLFTLMLLYMQSFAQKVKRGRNEGTFNIPASNVLGNGNITAYTTCNGRYLSTAKYDELEANIFIGAGLGIANILQINAQTSFRNFRQFGVTEAHLHLTTPNNDNLRFIGCAFRGDLYLSTSIDTLKSEADIDKPEYSPYLLASFIMDLDLMARPRQIPLKTYFFMGLADDPGLLYEYSQITIQTGFEWKQNKNSYFTDLGLGFYKYKHVMPNQRASFNQHYGWVSPGFRFRFFKGFSFMGSLRLTLFRNTSGLGSLNPERVSVSFKLETPILYRETNTEAIRTLIFMEKNKIEVSEDRSYKDFESGTDILDKIDNSISDLDLGEETFDYKKEKEDLIKQREKIQEKMDEIEKLLEED